jgi:hypothetical protein
MKTTVVNVRDAEQGKHTVYIGRPGIFKSLEKKFGTNKPMNWGNPYLVGDKAGQHSRKESIRLFREKVLSDQNLLKRIANELPGEVLGCFCKPEACHGDILAEFADMSTREPAAYQILIDRARTK